MPISEKRKKEIIEDIAILATHFRWLCTSGKPISEDNDLAANILHNKDAMIECQELIVDLKSQLAQDANLEKALKESISFSHLTEDEKTGLVGFVLNVEELLITLGDTPDKNDVADNEVNEQAEFKSSHHTSLPEGVSDTTLAAIELNHNPNVVHDYLTDKREELTTKIWCLRITRFFLGWYKSAEDCHSIDKKIEYLVNLRSVLETQQNQPSTSVANVHAVVEQWKNTNCYYKDISEIRDKSAGVSIASSQSIVDKITQDTRPIFKKK